MPLPYLQELTDYWRHGFDWRAQEARLNEIPQFTPRSTGSGSTTCTSARRKPNALPLLITHGYPSSVVEFMDLIGPLIDPRSHGGDPRGRVRPRHPVAARLRVLYIPFGSQAGSLGGQLPHSPN